MNEEMDPMLKILINVAALIVFYKSGIILLRYLRWISWHDKVVPKGQETAFWLVLMFVAQIALFFTVAGLDGLASFCEIVPPVIETNFAALVIISVISPYVLIQFGRQLRRPNYEPSKGAQFLIGLIVAVDFLIVLFDITMPVRIVGCLLQF